MDELELRIAAVEQAFIWAFGLTDEGPAVYATLADRVAMLEASLKQDLLRMSGGEQAAGDAAKALRQQSDDVSLEQRAVMLDAARLLEDAVKRWGSPFASPR